MNNYLITIVGPTAIGKTSLSIALAKYFETEILSCDSRQFYKEMTIGTAVPSEEELVTVKHHFIQNRSIFTDYNVGDFETDALRKLTSLFKKKSVVIMVGGSGLYVDAVLQGLDDFPDIDSSIRRALQESLEKDGIEQLQDRLKKLDPVTYKKIDLFNKQRLLRALEVCMGTGKPYSSFLTKNSAKRNFKSIKIGLTADRTLVYNRINERVDKMITTGLLEEAKNLYPHRKLNALQTVGYKEIFNFLEGKWNLDVAISEIKKNTRRFAKRQFTWFKKDKEIQWFAFDEPFEYVVSHIQRQIT